MYACSVVFYLNCKDSMVVCDSLFIAMLMPYSLMTCIKIYFIRNTILIVPSCFGVTYYLCCVLKSSNSITLASPSIIHFLCYEPTPNNLIIDVSVTIN